MKKSNHKKVILAMSGGVDSSVAAYLLLQKGYDVEGIFMKNWEEDDNFNYCSARKDLDDTRAVCKQMNIFLHEVNFSSEYWDNVFKNFLSEHHKGKTPNPDVLCNKEIKFGILFQFAIDHLQADYLATGHYARIQYFNKAPMLLRAIDLNKDQTYFLYTLSSNKLRKILFPVGVLYKSQVRAIAKKLNLVNAHKKDSTGICFIGSSKSSNFLSRFIKTRPGNIINDHGYIIGKHTGLVNYTIGQRKGIGIGGQYNVKSIPWYVVDKQLMKNSLIVVQGINNVKLMSIGLIATDVHWIHKENISNVILSTVKTRYRQYDTSCKIILLSLNIVKILFFEPISSITPGQSVVFYHLNICLGGGIIKYSIPLSKF